MSRTREQAISVIEQLFPADSALFTTSVTGRALLQQAQREAQDWRQEPIEVLQRYAELCEAHELNLARQADRNADYGH